MDIKEIQLKPKNLNLISESATRVKNKRHKHIIATDINNIMTWTDFFDRK